MFRDWSRQGCGGQSLDLKECEGKEMNRIQKYPVWNGWDFASNDTINSATDRNSIFALDVSKSVHWAGLELEMQNEKRSGSVQWLESGAIWIRSKTWNMKTWLRTWQIHPTIRLGTNLSHDLSPIKKNLVSFPEAVPRRTRLLTCEIQKHSAFT